MGFFHPSPHPMLSIANSSMSSCRPTLKRQKGQKGQKVQKGQKGGGGGRQNTVPVCSVYKKKTMKPAAKKFRAKVFEI